mmetsp:Transcript_4098/g.9661  ORF Transcript_4098/g.9661 Transcript_4098/m.9661 type:complete len:160 (+) Transcript_4098:872-1351(+)
MTISTRSKAKQVAKRAQNKGVVEDTAHSKSKAKAQFKAQFKAKSKSTTKTKTKPKSKSKSKPKPKPKARTKPKGPKVTREDFEAVAEAATARAKLANKKADMNTISISNHSKMLKFLYINQRRTQAVDLAIVVFLLVVFRSAIADNSAFLLDIVKRFWE